MQVRLCHVRICVPRPNADSGPHEGHDPFQLLVLLPTLTIHGSACAGHAGVRLLNALLQPLNPALNRHHDVEERQLGLLDLKSRSGHDRVCAYSESYLHMH